MKRSIKSSAWTLAVLILMASSGLALLAAPEASEPSLEVTTNPALLLSPTAKVADLTVYGVKLGDAIDKIPAKIEAIRTVSEHNPQVIYTAGRDVTFMSHNGKIVEIVVGGAILDRLAPYDTTRLQVALGKADEIHREQNDEPTAYLSYFQRRLQFVVSERALRSRIVEINLYAP